jgi:hypothetical protein
MDYLVDFSKAASALSFFFCDGHKFIFINRDINHLRIGQIFINDLGFSLRKVFVININLLFKNLRLIILTFLQEMMIVYFIAGRRVT